MLTVPVPALTRNKYGLVQVHLREEGLIIIQLVHTPKGLFEAAYPLNRLSSQQQIRGTGRRSGSQRVDQRRKRRWLEQGVELYPELRNLVAVGIFGFPRPAVPVLALPVDHTRLGM